MDEFNCRTRRNRRALDSFLFSLCNESVPKPEKKTKLFSKLFCPFRFFFHLFSRWLRLRSALIRSLSIVFFFSLWAALVGNRRRWKKKRETFEQNRRRLCECFGENHFCFVLFGHFGPKTTVEQKRNKIADHSQEGEELASFPVILIFIWIFGKYLVWSLSFYNWTFDFRAASSFWWMLCLYISCRWWTCKLNPCGLKIHRFLLTWGTCFQSLKMLQLVPRCRSLTHGRYSTWQRFGGRKIQMYRPHFVTWHRTWSLVQHLLLPLHPCSLPLLYETRQERQLHVPCKPLV